MLGMPLLLSQLQRLLTIHLWIAIAVILQVEPAVMDHQVDGINK